MVHPRTVKLLSVYGIGVVASIIISRLEIGIGLLKRFLYRNLAFVSPFGLKLCRNLELLNLGKI